MPARLRASPVLAGSWDPARTECVVPSVPCHCPSDVSHHIQERLNPACWLNPANSFVKKLPMCPWPFKTASVLAEFWRRFNAKVTAATLQRGTTTAASIAVRRPRSRPGLFKCTHLASGWPSHYMGSAADAESLPGPGPGRWAWTLRNRATAIRLLCLRPAPPGAGLVCARFPNVLPASFPSLPLLPRAVHQLTMLRGYECRF